MRITEKVLKETIKEHFGDEELRIVSFLRNRKSVSEFVIAEKLKTDVNKIRSILYNLQNHNLTSYIRKKDKDRGWSVSYWSFNLSRVKDIIKRANKKKLETLKSKLKKESEYQYYECPENCLRINLDSAADFSFRCPECGKLLRMHDNRETIRILKKEISRLMA